MKNQTNRLLGFLSVRLSAPFSGLLLTTKSSSPFALSVLFAFLFSLLIGCSTTTGSDSEKKEDNPPEITTPELVTVNGTCLQSYQEKKVISDAAARSGIKLLLGDSAPVTQIGVRLYEVKYYPSEMDGANTGKNGEALSMQSGVVAVPDKAGSYSMLSWQHYTITNLKEAPSKDINGFLSMVLHSVAALGVVQVAADYPGYGADSKSMHPYMIKDPTVASTRGMICATHELLQRIDSVQYNDSLYLYGYSQGAWATMALHKSLEKEPMSMPNSSTNSKQVLAGTVAGGGPFNLEAIIDTIISSQFYSSPYLAAFVGASYAHYYEDYIEYNAAFPAELLDSAANSSQDTNANVQNSNQSAQSWLHAVFKQPFADSLLYWFNADGKGFRQLESLPDSVHQLFTQDFIQEYRTKPEYAWFIAELQNNSVTAWESSAPLLLFHSQDDEVIHVHQSEAMRDSLKALHQNADLVQLELIQGKTHGGAAINMIARAVEWFGLGKN
jgi:pimeloyl-ACP methyl ester carboxylesterase